MINTVEQALLRSALERADRYEWTVQGFGMVRTYLDGDAQRWRLNIWDDRLQTPGVSLIHDHPWSFTSFILCGRINNQRFAFEEITGTKATHFFKEIVTGPTGADASTHQVCQLAPKRPETYPAGHSYSQNLKEVHETRAQRGTVTLNDRTPPHTAYTARVFWPVDGNDWMAARPRPARWSEVESAVQAAMRLL